MRAFPITKKHFLEYIKDMLNKGNPYINKEDPDVTFVFYRVFS